MGSVVALQKIKEPNLHLLQKLRYENCATNLISAGGAEIDVIGEYEIPGPLTQRTDL